MAIITGTSAGDTLVGGPDDDTIHGGDGSDLLSGGAGNDTLDGQGGADTLSGGDGNDLIFAGMGDIAHGDAGNDALEVDRGDGSAGSLTLDGGAGDDFIYLTNAAGQTVHAFGGDGVDTFRIDGDGPVVLDGGAGDDIFMFVGYQQTNAIEATVTLGAGRDRLVTTSDMFAPPHVLVTDFTPGDQGDRIDLSGYLVRVTNYGNTDINPFTSGFARLTPGPNTEVQVVFGGAWHSLFVLQGVSADQLTAANFEGWSPTGGPRVGLDLIGSDGADSLVGTAGGDTLSGGAGDDSLFGGAGDDSLSGGGGDDTLDGSSGNNVIDGGDGNDLLHMYYNGTATFHGGAGDDRLDATGIVGGAYYGDAGNDTFSMMDDQDVPGRFLFDMGDGNDVLNYYGRGLATVLGGAGDDRLTVGGVEFLAPTEVTVDAGTGDDTVIVTGGGHYVVTLGPGADTIGISSTYRADEATGRGTQVDVTDFNPAEDHIAMGMANFRLGQLDGETVIQAPSPYGGADNWQTVLRFPGVSVTSIGGANFSPVTAAPDLWLLGGTGADTIAAGGSFSHLDGGAGDDQMTGSSTADVLRGGYGDDSLSGLQGADTLDGGYGNDTISGGGDNDVITDIGGSNYLRGDDGDDQITGGYQFDDINGNKGDDTIDGGSGGNDWLVGGQGDDLITAHASQNILYGNLGNDTLHGGSGGDLLRGGQGDDSIVGGTGSDWISGDRGDDTITGGFGADTFHTFSGAGIDRVLDFSIAQHDRVQVDAGATYTVTQVGADTLIDLGNGDEMILVGVKASTLTGAWIFAA